MRNVLQKFDNKMNKEYCNMLNDIPNDLKKI